MAGKIRGITIEIDGNTKKFQDSLKGMDSQLNKSNKKLRDINKLLKLKPGNTELLTQKQKTLSKAIETTEDRLKELKSVQRESVSPEEWDAIQREIVDSENKLSGLKQEMKNFGSVGAQQVKVVGEKLQAFGNGMKDVGAKLTKYVTGPIVALGGASLAAFNEVDAGLDIITKKTGATGDAMDEMGEIMKDIATTIPTDFETAGTAIGEVSTRFGLTGDALEDLSGQFIKFADLNNTDVNSSIDLVQKALTAFGLESEDAGALLDRMNKVAQDTGVSVDTLEQGLIQNSTAFQEMGFSIDQATTFMGDLEKSGADSSSVMAGLRRALKNATKEGIPLDQALSDLQNTIKNGTGETDGLSAAFELFGNAGQQIFGAVQDGTIDFNNLAGAIEDAGGSVSDTFEATQDPTDEFKTAMNELKVTGMELAQAAMPLIQKAMEKLTSIIEKLKAKWEELSPEQQEMAIKIGLVAAAVGPLLMGLGSLISTVGMLMTFAPVVMGALSGMAMPIMIAVAAIAGLVSAGVLLYQNWDTIKARAKELGANIQKKFSEIKSKVVGTVSSMASNVKGKWESLKSSAGQAFESIKKKITEPIESAKQKVEGAVNFIKGLFPISIGNILSNVKLPHFSLKWGEKDFGPLGNIRYPTGFNLSWNAKGAIFRRPTIFATPIGYQGIGEAGAEAVLPLDALWNGLREMGDDIVNGIARTNMGSGEPVVINLYAYPSGPKMEQWVVNTYDRGKRRLG